MHYVHIASNEKREGEKNELIKHQKSYVLSIYLFLFVNTVIFYVNYLPDCRFVGHCHGINEAVDHLVLH